MGDTQRYYICDKVPLDMMTSKSDLFKHHLTLIRKWEPSSDVWPLIYGHPILSGIAAITGIYVNDRFRAKLKMRSYGSHMTMIGVAITSFAMVHLTQSQFVLHKLLTYEVSCPLCLESTSALVQTFGGVMFPLFGAAFANFSLAAGSGTCNVPYQYDFRGIFKTICSIYRPLLPKLAIIFTFHALVAGFITYSQVKSFLYIEEMKHLMEQDKKRQLKLNDLS